MSRPAAVCHPAEGKSDMSSSLLPSIKPEEKQIDAGQLFSFSCVLIKMESYRFWYVKEGTLLVGPARCEKVQVSHSREGLTVLRSTH